MPDPTVFRAIAEFTYDWETWVDVEGRTRWVNAAVERITGWSAAECRAMDDYPLAFVAEEDQDRVRHVLRSASEGTAGNDLEFRILCRDGSVRWGAISWQSLFDAKGKRLGYRTSVRDITERKRIEQRLFEALRDAQSAAKAKADFLAHVSHELRSPIHNILGFGQLLAKSLLDKPQQDQLSLLRDEAKRLLAFVDDLLDVTAGSLERADFSVETTNLGALVAVIAEAYRPRIEASGLSLNISLPEERLELVSERHAIERILRNLLDNACKYTKSGTIYVSVFKDMGGAKFAVKDTGIGMDPGDIGRLRRPFRRGAGQGVEGAGLGLAICDRLAELLGGELNIESSPGEGTVVWVSLPSLVESQSIPSEAAVETTVEMRSQRVLVVDDRSSNRELARALLLELDCDVETAATVEQAVALFRASLHEVVLMDLHMPGIDGVDAAQLIRAEVQAVGSLPRIIAVTADVFLAEYDRAMFDGYLAKPVDLETLRRCLSEDCSREPEPSQDGSASILDLARVAEMKSISVGRSSNLFVHIGTKARDELLALRRKLLGKESYDIPIFHDIAGAAGSIGARKLAHRAERIHHRYGEGHQQKEAVEIAREIDAVLEALERELDPRGDE